MENSVRNPDPSYEQLELERRFWNDHFDEFLARYPESFVAVRDGRVVATDADLDGLAAKLRALSLGRRDGVSLRFVSLKVRQLLL